MSLSGWDDTKKLKLTIDNSKVNEELIDFPILIALSPGCGIGTFDATHVFNGVSAHPYEVCDGFTGSNGSSPDTNLWRDASVDVTIQNNKLRFADNNNNSYANTEFALSGDFNIQVDFEIINGPSTNDWTISIIVYMNDNPDRFFVRRGFTGGSHVYWANEHVGGAWSNVGGIVGSTDTSGKLCMVRVGNTFSGYFWHNTGYWYKLGSKTYSMAQKDIKYIKLDHVSWGGNPSFGFYFDNFKVNNGTPYFPSRLAITTTVSGVETQCYTEIERWEQENNKAFLWTKVSTIVSGSDTGLSLYYDKSHLSNWGYVNIVGTTAAKAVWNSNFVGVWHMSQDPTGGSNCIKDSTSSGSHGASGGSMVSGDLVDGKIGKALDFDGSDDYIEISDLFYSNLFTLEAVINPLANGISDSIIVKRNSSGGTTGSLEWAFLTNDTKLYFQAWDSVGSVVFNTISSYGSVVSGTNTYVAGVATGKDNDCFLMINNTKDGTYTQLNNIKDGTSKIQFGTRTNTNNDRWFGGIIDEVRISTVSRSEAWLKATYYSNWDNLITYEQYERCFSGVVNVEGEPAIRRVNLYNQDTGELINYTTSASGTGEWLINVYGDTTNKYYAVCVPESSDRNAEIFAHVTGI